MKKIKMALALCVGAVAFLPSVLGAPTFAETRNIKTGDVSVHPAFEDGAFYEGVVDAYYRQAYFEEHGDYSGYVQDASHWSEILTNEQLASIKKYECSGSPVASQAAHITSFAGIELLTGVEDFGLETCIIDANNLDFSHMPQLRSFHAYYGSSQVLDFSNNPELRSVIVLDYLFNELDLSFNKKLEVLELIGAGSAGSGSPGVGSAGSGSPKLSLKLPKKSQLKDLRLINVHLANSRLDLKENELIKKIFITGLDPNTNNGSIVKNAFLSIIQSISTRLEKVTGLGAGDGADAEEYYTLDVSSLDFLHASNTLEPSGAPMMNETFTAKDPECYVYNTSNKTFTIKSSCIKNGLNSVTLVHSYTINGDDYTNEFAIDFRPVEVVARYFYNDELQNSETKLISQKYIYEKFSTSENEKPTVGVLKKVNVSAYNEDGAVDGLTISPDSTTVLKNVTIADSDAIRIVIDYYYEVETPDSPETGLFTGSKNGLSISNIVKYVAGGLIMLAPVVYLVNRVVKRKNARKF